MSAPASGSDVTMLLPAAGESMRCSEYARRNAVDPGGTAIDPDVLVLVEVPRPWPKPVARHEELKALVAAATGRPEQIRVIAATPHDSDRPRLISLRRRDGGRSGLVRAQTVLGPDPVSDLDDVLTAGRGSVYEDAGPATSILVCTQGSHDVCCGTFGTELADWIEKHRSDVELFRVSHTGGHRFAPTAMTFPDGRMWAYLTSDLCSKIIDRDVEPRQAAPICRGWWGASAGPGQVAERAVFAEVGWAVRTRTVAVTTNDDGSRSVDVEVDGATWNVVVEPGREVPTIACEAPGGQPVKPGRGWSIVSCSPSLGTGPGEHN